MVKKNATEEFRISSYPAFLIEDQNEVDLYA